MIWLPLLFICIFRFWRENHFRFKHFTFSNTNILFCIFQYLLSHLFLNSNLGSNRLNQFTDSIMNFRMYLGKCVCVCICFNRNRFHSDTSKFDRNNWMNSIWICDKFGIGVAIALLLDSWKKKSNGNRTTGRAYRSENI